MPRQRVPDDVFALAHARRQAREAHDWAEADRLRAEIEAAGWKVVDRGIDFSLEPAHPPDLAGDGETRYGRSSSVPSRLDEPATSEATVVLVDQGWPEDVARAVEALRRHVPDGTQVVVSSPSRERLPDAVEAVRTTEPLGHAAMLNGAIRRASGRVVIILDPSVEPTGDLVTPLVEALGDPSVAVAGGWGVRSRDLRHFDEAEPGDVAAVEGYALAFRRVDYRARGPLDEKFRFYRNLDLWWSLVLRDEGPDHPPRRAVSVELPARRHEHRAWEATPPDERDRLSKRNFYRIIDRFRSRPDLAVAI